MPEANWIDVTTMQDAARGYRVEIDGNSERSRHALHDWEGFRESEWEMGLPPLPEPTEK